MKKRTILMKMKNFDTYSQSVEDYKSMTREQFAGLVITGIDGSPLVTSDKKWLDEAGKYKDAITTLRVRYRFFWKDQFGERYFQSSKNITVGESMYMIEKVL